MDKSAAGVAALALFVLWLGFWVPHLLRHREDLVASRLDDRFSGGLRVLAVADGPVGVSGTAGGGSGTGSAPLLMAGRSTGTGGGERAMRQVQHDGALVRRPATGAVSADRVSRLAQLERRAARARRRLVLTLLLLLVSVVAWALVAFQVVHWYVAAVPSAFLAVVLVLGRIAVVAGRRSDARWAAAARAARQQATQARALANGGPYVPRNRARVTGHAVQSSATRTQMIPRVSAADIRRAAAAEKASTRDGSGPDLAGPDVTSPDAADPTPVAEPAMTIIEEPGAGASRSGIGGEAWDPVPVPLPTYVTKPMAPRREPRPLSGATPVAASSSAPQAGDSGRSDAAREELMAADPPRPATETLGLPLEQILARRRAAG